jgi:hypothetical protein
MYDQGVSPASFRDRLASASQQGFGQLGQGQMGVVVKTPGGLRSGKRGSGVGQTSWSGSHIVTMAQMFLHQFLVTLLQTWLGRGKGMHPAP